MVSVYYSLIAIIGEAGCEEPPERPAFSTNIFDDRALQQEPSVDYHWFWFSIVILIFFVGVASSYYIIFK